jgi:hypothetical protein
MTLYVLSSNLSIFEISIRTKPSNNVTLHAFNQDDIEDNKRHKRFAEEMESLWIDDLLDGLLPNTTFRKI